MDIYQRPANLFVATFIGRSNVLDGELRMENGKPVLHFHAGASITLDNVRAEECKTSPSRSRCARRSSFWTPPPTLPA